MNDTKITKKALAAVERILRDGRSIDAMHNGQIETEDGYAITDGFVLIHSPLSLTEQKCKAKDLDRWGGVLRGQFQSAHETSDDGVYHVIIPFQLVRVASTLRGLCKQYQATNRFNQSYITFTGKNRFDEQTCATFNVRHVVNAFDCVGRKAVGMLCKNSNLFGGAAFLLVLDRDDLENGIQAIVMQSRCSEGV